MPRPVSRTVSTTPSGGAAELTVTVPPPRQRLLSSSLRPARADLMLIENFR